MSVLNETIFGECEREEAGLKIGPSVFRDYVTTSARDLTSPVTSRQHEKQHVYLRANISFETFFPHNPR